MKFFKVFYKIYLKVFPDLTYYLKKNLYGCESVLDLGCGPDSLIKHCKVPFKMGVELFVPYVKESMKKKIHNKYLNEDITKVSFEPKSFDAIIMIDVLEHLTKEEGERLIEKMGKWAKKKIIIFTPNEFIENDYPDGNHLQKHKSGWSAEDLKNKGFDVNGLGGWKELRGKGNILKFRPYKLFIFISDITQKMVYNHPKWAMHLFAVKDLNKY